MIYLDNAATTKAYDEVIDYMSELMKSNYGNASSLHEMGFASTKLVTYANEQILESLGLKDRRVIYTSGATESANLAIKGTFEKLSDITKHEIITGEIEHPCVLEVCRYYASKGVTVKYLPTDKYGAYDLDVLKESMTENTKMVSLMWVNNELGSVLDIAKVVNIVKSINKNTLIHIDAVQGFTKLNANFSDVDLITISGHKFHAPKGVGALIAKKDMIFQAQNLGGSQQDGFRSGTINSISIAAMGKACELSKCDDGTNLSKVQKHLYDRLCETFSKDMINSKIDEGNFAPHIMSISFEGIKSEVILHMLEQEKIYVSSASACFSHKKGENHVLKAIGRTKAYQDGTIRISLSKFNTIKEIDKTVDTLEQIIKRLSFMKGKK